MRQTRRDVLRRSGQLTALGVALSTAGCSGEDVLGGGDDSPEEDEEDSGPPLAPSEWVGAPGVIGDRDHGNFLHADIATLLDNEDELDESFAGDLTSEDNLSEAAGLEGEDAVASVSWSGVSVTQGNFDESDVVSNLEEANFEEEESQSGFTILVGSAESDFPGQGVGVAGNKIIEAEGIGDMEPEEVVATAIDVSTGDEDRYADENDDFQALLDEIGIGTITSGRTFEELEESRPESGQFEGNLATATRYDVDGESSDYTRGLLFGSSEDVVTEDVEVFVDEQEDSQYSVLAEAEGEVNVSESGRAAVIEATVPTDQIFAG